VVIIIRGFGILGIQITGIILRFTAIIRHTGTRIIMDVMIPIHIIMAEMIIQLINTEQIRELKSEITVVEETAGEEIWQHLVI
jgi:hypothetical protein